MHRRDVANGSEPDAAAWDRVIALETHSTFEHAFALIRRDSGPVVADDDLDIASRARTAALERRRSGADDDVDPAPGRRELQRVAHEVHESLLQLHRVTPRVGRSLGAGAKHDSLAAGDPLEERDGSARQVTELDVPASRDARSGVTSELGGRWCDAPKRGDVALEERRSVGRCFDDVHELPLLELRHRAAEPVAQVGREAEDDAEEHSCVV